MCNSPLIRIYRSNQYYFLHTVTPPQKNPNVMYSLHLFLVTIPYFTLGFILSILFKFSYCFPTIFFAASYCSVVTPMISHASCNDRFSLLITPDTLLISLLASPYSSPSFLPSFLPSFIPSSLPSFLPSSRPCRSILTDSSSNTCPPITLSILSLHS